MALCGYCMIVRNKISEYNSGVQISFMPLVPFLHVYGTAHFIFAVVCACILLYTFFIVSGLKKYSGNHKKDEKRHEIELLYKLFFEQVAVGVVFTDARTGRYLRVNKRYCDITGYSEEEIKQMGMSDLVYAEDIDSYLQKLELLLAGKIHDLNMVRRYVRKDGQIVWVKISVANMWNPGDPPTTCFVIVQDVTEQVQQEKIIGLKDELIQLTGEMAKVGGWEYDVEAHRKTWTDVVAKIYDVDPNVTDIQFFLQFYTPGSARLINDALAHAIECAVPYDLELEMISAKGAHKWVRTKGFPVTVNGKVTKVRGILQDITERKKIEEDLIKAKKKAQESERLKTTFLQNMSHEIRTPMNAIVGFSDLLLMNLNNEMKMRHFISIIKDRSSDLLTFINDIIDISKIDSGQLPVNTEKCYIRKILEELYAKCMHEREKSGKSAVEITFSCKDNSSHEIFYIDKQKVKKIFENLLNNAIRFTFEGSIEYGYFFTEAEDVIFYVKDTGIGIPSDKHDYIFKHFAQLKHEKKVVARGTGIGLSIAKGLVEFMGGRIWVESEVGKGTCFYFTIPCRTTAPATPLP